MLYSILTGSLLVAHAVAQTTVSAVASSTTAAPSTTSLKSASVLGTVPVISGVTASLSTIANASASVPTGSYPSYTTTILLATSASNSSISSSSATGSKNGTVTSSAKTSNSLLLVGSAASGTATSAAAATNTQACNNYPELCNRKYSNITQVCAHNSAFSVSNNLFSNQAISITGQLNDGIRMIQGEVHYVNKTMYSCHTSCDYLNAGTYESELLQVRQWLDANPFDVVTLLIVNSDYVDVGNFTSAFTNSGMSKYVYTPPKIPMNIGDWPTLAELILMEKRAIVFMDYQADQSVVPYIVDEFSAMFETPFSPTDPSFPCTAQRPPNIAQATAEQKLYLANHNLDVEFSLLGADILIPDFANIATVNGVTGSSSLETMAETCVADWGRPPNFLLVDFYNEGTFTMNGQTRNGSVFEVAATMNGLTYSRSCCGEELTLSSDGMRQAVNGRYSLFAFVMAVVVFFV